METAYDRRISHCWSALCSSDLEPEITRQGETIGVSLPGVPDAERARELVGQTAELRFRPVLNQLPVGVDSLDELTSTPAAGDPAPTEPTEGTRHTPPTTAPEAPGGGQPGPGPAQPFQHSTTNPDPERTAHTPTTPLAPTTNATPQVGKETD